MAEDFGYGNFMRGLFGNTGLRRIKAGKLMVLRRELSCSEAVQKNYTF
jgi:hypothetical protein